MSNFVSGIFKKCKYGGYFIIYLIAFINLIGFGYCKTITNIQFPGGYEFYTQSNFIGNRNIKEYYGLSNDGFGCIFVNNVNLCTLNDGTTTYNMGKNTAYCTNSNTVILNCTSTAQYYYITFLSEELIREFYPETTIGECQTKYNLVPVSDLNSCQNDLAILSGNYNTCRNDLYTCEGQLSECELTPPNCTSCENDLSTCQQNLSTCGTYLNTCNNDLNMCMNGSINTGTNRSAIFINNIQHIGKPIINITIPEEIARDYTGTENSFDLNVEGYGYDEEKMINMIDIQNYKPTSKEMSQLIGKFADFVPLLGICLLFIAIRYIAKRIFRG